MVGGWISSARPSFFHSNCCCSIAWKETCCCSRSSITESWRMEFPKSLGGFGNQVNLRSLNPALFCEISDLNKVPAQDGLHAFVSYQSEKFKCCQKGICFSLLPRWGCIFESICPTYNYNYRIYITICLLKHKALGKMLVLTLQTSFGHHLLGKNGSSTAPKSSSCVHRWNQRNSSQEGPSLRKDLHRHGARVQAEHVPSHVPIHLLPLQHPSMP